MNKQSNHGTLAWKQKSCDNRDPNKSEVLKSCKATVMTNDFELNILLVDNGTSEISVKWGVNNYSCIQLLFYGI